MTSKEPPKDIRLLVEETKRMIPLWEREEILMGNSLAGKTKIDGLKILSSALLIALEGFEWIEDHDFPHIDDPLCSCNQCTAKQTLKRINSLPITHER